ncbi:hypothetical protein [Actinoplanes sp. TFC3]|uniref:hypothetical protein n=1 Tax=Actinoplanes sp. TFC3 TaxID=1710355 RepID=UPI001F1C9CF1|nr:hypothetical protein [Actinoplanes sp. TFC3]
MRTLIAARPWLRVYQQPSYAPELNPVEKIWSAIKLSLGNLSARKAGTLSAAVKNRLKKDALPPRPDRRLPHRNGSITTNADQTLTTKGL